MKIAHVQGGIKSNLEHSGQMRRSRRTGRVLGQNQGPTTIVVISDNSVLAEGCAEQLSEVGPHFRPT
jgi:hypothetical protein